MRFGAKRKTRNAGARPFFSAWSPALALAAVIGLTGCSTPGPTHLYLYSPAAGERTVRDVDPFNGAEFAQIPAFHQPGEFLLGIAYDPFTDHLFLRLFPGNFIRVIDRPAGAIKRTFTAPSLPLGGHDLAIRSRDRHLFFTDPTGPALIETTLYGVFVRHIPLAGLDNQPHGVAHDARTDELLVLPTDPSDRLLRYSLAGEIIEEVTLEYPVQGYSLAYDSTERTIFASLADASAIGVFDAQGRLLRRLSRPAAEREVFIDLGQRSLLRMF